MEMDNIVSEELSVSIVNYFLYFFLCILLYLSQNSITDPDMIFVVPFVLTFVHFSLTVWYRRKERLSVSTFISTINYLFQSDIYKENIEDTCYYKKRTNIFSLISKDIRSLIMLIFLCIVFVVASLRNSMGSRYTVKEELLSPPVPKINNITLSLIAIITYASYIYASLIYKINQLYWVLVLLFLIGILSKIIYDKKEANQPESMKLLFLSVTVFIFIYVRYLVLGYSILPF